MPATLVSETEVPILAGKVTSTTLLKTLRLLGERDFIPNGPDLEETTAGALKRLAELGLADPGYAGPTEGPPFIWVRNANGDRVLRHLEQNPRYEVRLHPRAATALESLPPVERDAVLGSVETLKMFAPSTWPTSEVLPLGWDGDEFMLSVSPDVRAFVKSEGGQAFVVFDVMRAETLELFLRRQRAAGSGG